MGNYQVKSMTGFGRAQRDTSRGQFIVEVRTVNSRYQDVSISMPHDLNLFETPLRTLLKQEVPRGKIDCRIHFHPTEEHQPKVRVNLGLIKEYIEQMKAVQQAGVNGEVTLEMIVNLPGATQIAPPDMDEQVLWRYMRASVEQALEALNRERGREGIALAENLHELAERVRAALAQIEKQKDEVMVRFREKLVARVAELTSETTVQIDSSRIEMEVAMYADRCDITEEITRLKVHLDRFESLLNNSTNDAVGKNLEFLVQEFVREINTICSKSRDTDITGHALEMKNVVESIREQIQNIQ